MTHPLYSDEDLIVRLRADDTTAFEILYVRHKEKLFSAAIKRLKDRDTADEIVQEIFLSIWQRRHVISVTGDFGAYLSFAVRNSVIDHIRRSKTRKLFIEEIVTMAATASEEQPQRSDEKEKSITDELTQQIQSLPDKCRQVFILSYIENKSRAEIAALLEISQETAKYHIAHALRVLRTNLRHLLALLILALAL